MRFVRVTVPETRWTELVLECRLVLKLSQHRFADVLPIESAEFGAVDDLASYEIALVCSCYIECEADRLKGLGHRFHISGPKRRIVEYTMDQHDQLSYAVQAGARQSLSHRHLNQVRGRW